MAASKFKHLTTAISIASSLLTGLFFCDSGQTKALAKSVSGVKIVDLTHVLGPDLPDFHQGKAYEYKMLFTIEKNGYGDGQFTTPEHYGTHVDSPLHFFADGQSIDQIPASKLILPCTVIDVRDEVAKNSDYRLTMEKIQQFEKSGRIKSSVILLLTGWSKKFSDPVSYRNADDKGTMHYPAFGAEAADFLIKERHAQGLGLDTISADYGMSNDYPVHKKALSQGAFLIENLNNLDLLPARGATIFIGALRIKKGTGSPARILATLP